MTDYVLANQISEAIDKAARSLRIDLEDLSSSSDIQDLTKAVHLLAEILEDFKPKVDGLGACLDEQNRILATIADHLNEMR